MPKRILGVLLANPTCERLKNRTNIWQRQIYWLDDCEPLDGDEEKNRPVIVLASDEMLRSADLVLVVACSTHPRKKDIPRFLIPSRDESPEMGLPRKCWALPVNRFRLTHLAGNCPSSLFTLIHAEVLKQMDDDDRRNHP